MCEVSVVRQDAWVMVPNKEGWEGAPRTSSGAWFQTSPSMRFVGTEGDSATPEALWFKHHSGLLPAA